MLFQQVAGAQNRTLDRHTVPVAGGMSDTRHPRHKSPRVALPHEAPILYGVKADLGIGMNNARARDPTLLQSAHSRAVQVSSLTTTDQNPLS